ncbi:MAG: Nif3-like dinuclear metal center hexameric protein [Bacteroidota bacterium]
MTVQTVHDILEEWAPREIAWDRDNPGLQCGSPDARVSGILVTLDVNEEVIKEAKRKSANLILSHHPLLFKPLHAVDTSKPNGRCLSALLGAGISLTAVHTNADFTSGGTSFVLDEKLGLRNVVLLHSPFRLQKKIVTFVPADHVEAVASAMADAGAGVIGNYDHCSFRLAGTGTFRGNDAAHPAVGRSGRVEQVDEIRLEVVAPGPKIDGVVRALRTAHPYEEVAYDLYPIENRSAEYGMGTIGELARPRSLRSFLGHVRRVLGIPHLRFCGNVNQQIRQVAVCGGSGAELLEEAVRKGADVLVTADVRYHSFHDSSGRIALVDAGHYETERPVVGVMVAVLKKEIKRRRENVPVYESLLSTNPIQYI